MFPPQGTGQRDAFPPVALAPCGGATNPLRRFLNMPVKRVSNASLETEVRELEKKNRIVSVTESGGGAFVIVYEPRATRTQPGDKETRA